MQRTSLVTVLALCLIAGVALAADNTVPREGTDAISVPQLINYQGKLTDGSGNPLTGTYGMKFEIFNAATGPTSFWSETQTGVVVTEGLFNVKLGSVNPIDPATELPDGPECWLEITVGTAVISPRSQLVSVPYTHKSDDAAKLGGTAAASYALQSWVTANDAGRSGVAAELYEGTTKLADLYAAETHNHDAGEITSGTLPVDRGGTGLSGVGSDGEVLTVVSGAPAWAAPPASNFNYDQYKVVGTYNSSGYSMNNSWSQPITAFKVDLTPTGGPVLLTLHTGGWCIATYAGYSLIAGIRRDGTEIATACSGGVLPTSTTSYYNACAVNLSFIDTPTAGTQHTYTVWFRLSGATATARTVYQNYANNSTQMPGMNILTAIELKN